MSQNQQMISEFNRSLNELIKSLFPYTCKHCGAEFNNAIDFVEKTSSSQTQSNHVTTRESDSLSVKRICPCGKEVEVGVEDRRDDSIVGTMRRKQFDVLMHIAGHMGLSRDDARSELLRVLHGEESAVLRSKGVNLKLVLADDETHTPIFQI